MKWHRLVCLLILIEVSFHSAGQYASKEISSRRQTYIDSLKQVDYSYIFPIFGQRAYSRGFDVPYPAGIMGNFVWLDQGIIIDNMQLGLQAPNRDIPLTPVDFIQFGESRTTAYTVNVRPDVWIFPFLGVYGIFGYGNSTTTVNLTEPVALRSEVTQGLRTAGGGVIGAFGVGPVWMSVDWNQTWNKPELLDKAVRVGVLGVRVGHTMAFLNRPDRNFAIWVGGMRARMASETVGAIKLNDALPPETFERIDEIADDYWEWYNSLDPNNPVDAAKIAVADEVLTPIIMALEDRDGESVIRYGMDKRPSEEWNMVIGGQFQFNKRWMLRTEGGIIGDRKSWLLSLNYRFLM